jgi:hypothetical protein
MNGHGRRSAIVAVALVATMSAGAALAADTGLPPGFLKASFSSLDADQASLASSVSRWSFAGDMRSASYDTAKLSSTVGNGGIAAIGQALRQTEEAPLSAGSDYVSVLRAAVEASGLDRAVFSADRTASPSVDLTRLANGLGGSDSAGQAELAHSGFGTGSGSYSGRQRIAESAAFANPVGSRSPAVDLTRLAEGLVGNDSSSPETLANSGFGTGSGSYSGRQRIVASTAFSSPRTGVSAPDASYSAHPGRESAFNAAFASAHGIEAPSVDLTELAETLADG